MELSRRMFLTALLGLAAARVEAGPSDPGDLDRFLQLSSPLTGFRVQELDRSAGAAYLDVLRAWGEPIDQALAQGSLGPLSATVLELWYTGRYDTPVGHRSAAFRHALAWEALDFAHPPTYCGPAWWLH
ncbi:MAG: hypothetical protein HY319_24385 [Armatimonadetes bacterium]|nr:hypothetical protein [Armatimonadota bacterium]